MIGLTGGIAAGKSVVAERFRELGAVIIDADLISREIVEPGEPALATIVENFGAEVLTEDGRLNRAKLGARIFAEPQAREILNQIMHPEVKRKVQTRLKEIESSNPDAVVVYDVPLLVEAKVDENQNFDLVIVVDATEAIRLERLVRLRGLTPSEATARIQSQASSEERLAVADVVIDTNGTIQETLRQVDQVWNQIKRSEPVADDA